MTMLLKASVLLSDNIFIKLDRWVSAVEGFFQFGALAQAKKMIKSERIKDAIDVLSKKAQDTLDCPECYYLLGICYERLNQLNQAKHYYYQALVLDKQHLGAAAGLTRISVVGI